VGLELRVHPCPLPPLKVGEKVRVKLSLVGGRPGDEASVLILGGVNTTNGVCWLKSSGHQAFSRDPLVEFTIESTREGAPTIVVSSPNEKFEACVFNGTASKNAYHGFLGPAVSAVSVVQPPPKEALQVESHVSEHTDPGAKSPEQIKLPSSPKDGNEPTNPLSLALGLIAAFALFLGGAWFLNSFNQKVSQDEELRADNGEPAQVEGEPTDAVASASEPSTSASTGAPGTEPTGCDFATADRTMVGDKYLVNCAQGQYLALAQYQEDFSFKFSGFEDYPEPK
jgi:hypothetical protein